MYVYVRLCNICRAGDSRCGPLEKIWCGPPPFGTPKWPRYTNGGPNTLTGAPRALIDLLPGAQISRLRGALKGPEGATDDSRRAPMGPVGVLSVTAGLLGIYQGPPGGPC